MTDQPAPVDARPATYQPPAHPIMFWVLTGLALAIFVPCVLVPMWMDTEQLREEEQAMAAQVAELKDQIARNQARIEALLADPLVNERIARRELNYRPEGEEVIHWSPYELSTVHTVRSEEPLVTSADDPNGLDRWVATLSHWLPAWPWRDLFGRAPNRSLFLMMAGGLLLAAFVLYTPVFGRVPPKATRP
ncbi:MAG TPA: septum formation initiator family protein [Phycisphaerae bacterium]|nr:septum formation initiator family protein [Phycisphaerae bacterium]HRY66960.1 septum formation initiator family protein [Phycisphaerae bacterium]HSA27908.1 septum formation initiator family protein [Phycisphaerae bacterium]